MKKVIKKIVVWLYTFIIDKKLNKLKNIKDVKIKEKNEINYTNYQQIPYKNDSYINSYLFCCNLSIIIPVYNSEEHIEKCLDSILNQNTNYSYEVIVVNDGSTDSTAVILTKYINNPHFVLFSKENGGISSARNYGLSKASGEYIGFIDNDDWVSENYVETLLNAAYTNNADVVKCGYNCVYPNKEITHCNNEYKIYNNGLQNDLMNYDGLIWGGIQHRKIWSKCCFPEKYWFEDMISRCLIYRLAKNFVYVNQVLYFKKEHFNNASKTLWKIDNPKCLDQVFLVKEIINIDRILGINDDESLIRTILYEYGLMLFYRTTSNYKKIAFDLARNVLISNFDISYLFNLQLGKYEKAILFSLIYNDYSLWLQTVKCLNYLQSAE